jgi:hypothetical protein
MIVFSEAGLSLHLRNFVDYYHRSRTDLGLQNRRARVTPGSNHPTRGGLLQSPRWAGSIIGTSIAPPEPAPSGVTANPSIGPTSGLSYAPRRSRRHRLDNNLPAPILGLGGFPQDLAALDREDPAVLCPSGRR